MPRISMDGASAKLRHTARSRVSAAIQSGRLVRPESCSECGHRARGGRDMIQAHHPDYHKPLEIVWLCRRCHGKAHRIAERAAKEKRVALTLRLSPDEFWCVRFVAAARCVSEEDLLREMSIGQVIAQAMIYRDRLRANGYVPAGLDNEAALRASAYLPNRTDGGHA